MWLEYTTSLIKICNKMNTLKRWIRSYPCFWISHVCNSALPAHILSTSTPPQHTHPHTSTYTVTHTYTHTQIHLNTQRERLNSVVSWRNSFQMTGRGIFTHTWTHTHTDRQTCISERTVFCRLLTSKQALCLCIFLLHCWENSLILFHNHPYLISIMTFNIL